MKIKESKKNQESLYLYAFYCRKEDGAIGLFIEFGTSTQDAMRAIAPETLIEDATRRKVSDALRDPAYQNLMSA